MKTTQWIVVTGLDGSGKTTLVSNLQEQLTALGISVYRDRLPHDQYLNKTLLNKSQDAYTDRLLFALDNRLFATELREILCSGKYDIVLTQRGFLDSFVHGAVQGFSYAEIGELNRIADLPKCDIMVHMVCESRTAYSRIRNDPDADKFETPPYMRRQESETRRAYSEVINGNNPDLEYFFNSKNIYVDSTQMTTDEVLQYVLQRLKKQLHLPESSN